ncbi:MAG: carboxypeptidase regulatory-like domain-containing protein [Bacteroidota bacterium]
MNRRRSKHTPLSSPLPNTLTVAQRGTRGVCFLSWIADLFKVLPRYHTRSWQRRAMLHPATPILGLTLTVILAFFGCSKSDNSPTQSGVRTWTVSGEVHMLGAIPPLAGVVVKCAGVTGSSGTDGKYELIGVPEGQQTITAQRADCDDYSYVIKVEGNTNHHIFMTLNGVDLSGVVTNAIDGPISGARVAIRGQVALTDGSGKYEFSAVPHGTDTLTVTQPNYNAYRSSVTLAGSVAQINVVLTRDSTFQGIVDQAKYVDQHLPNSTYITPFDHMYLRANNPDTTGPNFISLLQHIYINFTFPVLLADQRVSIIDASLLMCSDGPYPTTAIKTYSLQSFWYSSLTYNTQPAIGSLLYSGSICDTSGSKFWQVLGTEGFIQVLTSYRSQGIVNGIVIKGGSAAASTGFYSTLAALALRPKFTIRVRY